MCPVDVDVDVDSCAIAAVTNYKWHTHSYPATRSPDLTPSLGGLTKMIK